MHLKRKILAVDAMLGRRMNVELSQTELVAIKGCGTVHHNLDGGVEVLEYDSLLGDIDDGFLSSEAD